MKHETPKFRTRFTPRIAVKQHFPKEEGRTKPEFAKECDINRIMAKYRQTGILPEYARQAAQRFGDFSQVPDFMEMQARVNAAMEMFGALPAAVRKQFNNDPHEFVQAASTKEGRELMVKLGLGKENPTESPAEGEKGPRGGEAPLGKTTIKERKEASGSKSSSQKPSQASQTPANTEDGS